MKPRHIFWIAVALILGSLIISLIFTWLRTLFTSVAIQIVLVIIQMALSGYWGYALAKGYHQHIRN